MEYETRQSKPRSKRLWLRILVPAVLILGLCSAMHFLNFPAIRVEKTDSGFSIHVGKAAKTPGEAPAFGELPVPENTVGSGQTLPLGASRPGVAYIAAEGAMSLQEIYAATIPSVVTVTTQNAGSSTQGTGIIMSQDGYIITNQHLVDSSGGISVMLSDSSAYAASLVGSDAASDLAVLKIDAENLTPAAFGDSDSLQVGDMAVTIGCPGNTGLQGILSDGIISGISRGLSIGSRTMTLLQTNAASNSSASGGPLLNCYGQVVGVYSGKLTENYRRSGVKGLGFVIPMNTAKPIVDELISHGYISGRGAIGITAEELPLRARIYFGLPEGAHVKTVDPSSDAHLKGLQPGDIITAFDGHPVTGPRSLSSLRDGRAAGDTVTLTVYRGGSYFDLSVILMDRAADE